MTALAASAADWFSKKAFAIGERLFLSQTNSSVSMVACITSE